MSNPLDNKKIAITDTLKYYKEMHFYLEVITHRNGITSNLTDICRSIMNKLEIGIIYLGKYKENIIQYENMYEINHCKPTKFSWLWKKF